MNTFDLSLDLDKRAGVTQWVTMRQGDHDGTQLRATIYDHGTQVSDSYTCRVSIRKPTEAEYYRETCSFSGGVAIVTIDEQYAASEVGITYGYFELLQGTAVIASTENFGVRILQSAIDGAIVAPPYDSAIEDALAELDEATGRISQMVIDATAEYLEAHPEITTTVLDNSITDAKLVQKGGILQREQWLESLVPVLKGITKETAEADVHSVTDSAGGGPLGIEVYGRSTQDGTPTPDAPVPIVSVGPDSDGGVALVAQRTSDTSQSVTIPIDLGGRSLRSLPDGTCDEVTIDEWGHARLIQRVGELTPQGESSIWSMRESDGRIVVRVPDIKPTTGNNDLSPSLSNRFVFKSLNAATSAGDAAVWPNETGDRARVALNTGASGISSIPAAAAWLAANPVTLVYPLVTPVTIDLGYLDPALLPAPDLTAYVVPSAPSVLRYGYTVAESTSSNLAPAETSPATASHAVGTLLTLDGQLVKVTSAIAVGEAVTIGGNVRTTTIAAELAALA